MSSYYTTYAKKQLAHINRETHDKCPTCNGKGGTWKSTGQTWTPSGNDVQRWSQCPRCDGECIIPKGSINA